MDSNPIDVDSEYVEQAPAIRRDRLLAGRTAHARHARRRSAGRARRPARGVSPGCMAARRRRAHLCGDCRCAGRADRNGHVDGFPAAVARSTSGSQAARAGRRRDQRPIGDGKTEGGCGVRAMSKCQDLDPLFAPYADGAGAPADARLRRRASRPVPAVPRPRRRATRRPRVAGAARRSWAGAPERSAHAAGPVRGASRAARQRCSALRDRAAGCRCHSRRRWYSLSPARSSSA